MIVLAACCLALATYWAMTQHVLPTRRPPREASNPAGEARRMVWSVTDRAREILGWSRRRLAVWRWISMIAVGLGVALLEQDVFLLVPFGWIGRQLPDLYLELRAAQDLARLQRQVTLFVGAVHDHLHARGGTVEDALLAATYAVGPGPMAAALDAYRRQVESGWSLPERLAALDRAVNWPSLSFFLSLLALRDETGTESMAPAFDSLLEKLQDDERLQAVIRGELAMNMTVLLISFALVIGIWPYYRIMSPNWPLYHQHLSILVTLSGLAAAIIFRGIHRFMRAQVAVAE